MTTRTPGPWRFDKVRDNRGAHCQLQGPWSGCSAEIIADLPTVVVDFPKGFHATFDHTAANAAFIVEACNTHDALVARCERLEAALIRAIDHATRKSDYDWIGEAYAALAKEGE